MADLTKTLAVLQAREWHGKSVAMPGVYRGIPLGTYHSAGICIEPSISSSGLRRLYNPSPHVVSSPAHYWCQSPYNPEREEAKDESAAMILGRAAHHLLFGEADFREYFVLRPSTINGEAWSSNKLICKAWKEKMERIGLTVITPEQLKSIQAIARALAREPIIQAGALNGEIERSWFWKDKETGVWCRIRPDASPQNSLDFVDLKLTSSVMDYDLRRTIRDYGYYMQAGLVATGVREITGQPLNSFSLVFCESKPPYAVDIVTLKDGDIVRGQEACRIALRKFAKCFKEKHWPGPRGDRADARYIEMAEFDQKRIDENLIADKGD